MTLQSSNPRLDRLRDEQQRLLGLKNASDHVKVAAVDELPSRPPERYKIAFLCRGIIGIDNSQNPIYGNEHEVEIYCDDEFPGNVPTLRWNTPIWHPNIQHTEPKHVCVNKGEWMGSTGLDDLCQQMFEMVQYRNYHAQNIPPYPLDTEAAKWVRDFAEPRGIVDKRRGISVDNQPFYKPRVTSERAKLISMGSGNRGPSSSGVRVRIGVGAFSSDASQKASAERMPATSAVIICRNCGASVASGLSFCVKCGTKLDQVRRVRIAY
jgi:ubiquitin-protein ligase